MKLVLFLAIVVGMVTAEQYYYVTENDYLDGDAVVADLPTLQSFIDCFLERGPCTSLTESYRRLIQDAIIRACDRCNLPQKQLAAKLLRGVKARLPHEYIAFRQKYDPYGIYFEAYEAEITNYMDYSSPIWSPYYYYLTK